MLTCKSTVYSYILFNNSYYQRAQLSQRDHAMLYVTEYFAKSLKVIREQVK